MGAGSASSSQAVQRERWKLLSRLEALLDKPMLALSMVWLGLLVIELTGSPNLLAGAALGMWWR